MYEVQRPARSEVEPAVRTSAAGAPPDPGRELARDTAEERDRRSAWELAWVEALDELELTLDATERLLRGENAAPGAGDEAHADAATDENAAAAAAWTPPALRGPMPVDLRTRALALHHRQQQVMRATADAATGLRRQAELTSRMSAARSEPGPVYLDITA